MLHRLKRLFAKPELSADQRLDQALAALKKGWSLPAFEALRRVAEEGHPAAQFELGRRYEKALGVVQSLDDAFTWYERAAEQKHAEAQARVGLMLLAGPPTGTGAPGSDTGRSTPPADPADPSGEAIRYRQDPERALHWNRLAARAGVASAQLRYGLQLAKGLGIERDLDRARQWLSRSAEQGDVAGMTALGVLYAGGYGGVPDRTSALRWLRRAAESGYSDAQYWLGVFSDPASATAVRPGPPTLAAAVSEAPSSDSSHEWLQQAAERGHLQATYQLGLAYWSGKQAPLDLSRAETWLRRAASRDHVDAMRALAQLQLEQAASDGIEAASLLWQAADMGDAASAALLGELYLQGRGVPRDAVEAARWLVVAGSQARPKAMTALASLQARDTDIEQGHGMARAWLEQAAQAGDLAATFTLGSLYHRGKGVPRNDRLAVEWYQRVAERGGSAAAFYLGSLFADVSSEVHDDATAIRWLRVATERGHGLAVCNWATMVYQGRGQAADAAGAERILRRAIARGNLAATTMLAQWLTDGRHLPQDPARAHALLQSSVVTGDAEAAAVMARLHIKHDLVADPQRLIDILTKACDDPRSLGRHGTMSIASARLALAQLLERLHADPDPVLAARILDLYERAAQGGMADAQMWLARRLEADPRFGDDPGLRQQAQRWIWAAALQGDVDALLRTTDAHADAGMPDAVLRGRPEDRFNAWVAASLSGHPAAQRELARLYLAGQGCEADPFLGVRWLQRAADQGDTEAQFLLADCLAEGKGCAKNLARARHGWRLAAAAGHERAGARLNTDSELAGAPTHSLDGDVRSTSSWRGVTRYEDPGFAPSIELIGETVVAFAAPAGKQWFDPLCRPTHHRAYAPLRAALPRVNAWLISDATVSAEFVVHKGLDVFLDCSALLHHKQGTNKSWVLEQLVSRMDGCDAAVDDTWCSERVLVMHNEGGDTWGHFLVQNVPRMLLFLQRFPEGKVAVPESHLTHLSVAGPAQLLQALAIPRERFIALMPRKRYVFGEVVLLDFLYDFERQIPYPQGLRLLNDRLVHAQPDLALGPPGDLQDRPCLIRRVPVEVGRHISNEDELQPVLRRFGIEVRELGDQPVMEQIRAWRSGRMVVSTLGSDLSNIVFAPRGSTVLAITPDWFGDDFFYRLAQACGIRWFELRCGRRSTSDAVDHRSAFAVDPRALETALAEAGGTK